jgi:hypothetical protein
MLRRTYKNFQRACPMLIGIPLPGILTSAARLLALKLQAPLSRLHGG